jgi:hypothetical protein
MKTGEGKFAVAFPCFFLFIIGGSFNPQILVTYWYFMAQEYV